VSRSKNRLKQLTKQIPNHAVTVAKLAALESGGHKDADRAIAILGGAFVENAVKVAIAAHSLTFSYDHNAVFGQGGPLYSFSPKIALGHALGIYGPKTRDDLDIVRNIRNAFAHALEDVDFSHRDIARECDKLHHVGSADLSLMLRGPKGKYVRAVINISDALRAKVSALGLLRRFPFPDKSLP
jgi:DNA-binding MltR family transcriptional regulator